MSSLLKNLGYAVLVTMLGVYVFLEMTGPRGLRELLKKREQIKTLQTENENLRQRNEMREERIRRLQESREEQELEIRHRFKLQKKDTVDFYLPPEEGASTDEAEPVPEAPAEP